MQLELRFPAKKFVAFAMTIIIFLSSVVTAVATTIAATIIDDGKTYIIQALSSETEEILTQARVAVGPSDIVTRDDEHGIVITIRRGREVNVTADGKTIPVVLYSEETANQALQKAGVKLGKNDLLNIPLSQELDDGAQVKVTRQHAIHVFLDGGFLSPTVSAGTVEQALKQTGVALNEDDIVTPSRDASVGDGLIVTVKRVTYREATSTEEIPYTTVTQESDTVSPGSFRITTVGQPGEREVVSREKLVDGVVTDREAVSSAVTKQPVAEVKLVAPTPKIKAIASVTNSGSTFTDKNGKSVSYKKLIKGKATAYTSNGGTTSTGKPAQYGYVAVDPKVIPYGTKLYITSPNGKVVYGYAEAADTGGAMLSGRVLVDLYYDTESQCRSFGVRNMLIYVLD
ncbi:3D domain-containing protein [Clostridium minihomine]|uniref:3D domain-containing protein n=1 Tax=Clostridium minihomine TaxID=2045012 RepID=UPI001FB2CD59|nr:3D domain-containing protein [Clostridium minihomine]